MAKAKIKCECGEYVSCNVGNVLLENTLRWYISYQCTKCGSIVELDEIDDMPHYIRMAITKEEGTYGLFINENKELLRLVYVLKKELGFKLEQIKEVKENYPNALIKGTKCEIQRINNILIKKGITSTVIKIT